MSNTMLVADVARRLGVSPRRVVQLDDRLQPERTASGWRIYDAARVEAFVVERDRRRALLAGPIGG